MKKIYLLFMLATAGINAQSFEWLQTPAITFAMNPDMIAYPTACDPAGNIYMTGFKDGAYPYNEILGNLYFNKYSSDGDVIFSKTISGKAFVYNMVSDNDGNIIMAVGFYGNITVDDLTLTEENQDMHYILVKLDNEGSLQWHRELMIENNGFMYVSDFRALDVDANNNIYAGYDSFSLSRITKFSPNGDEMMEINQEYVSRITSLDIDSAGNIYAAGSCGGNFDSKFGGVHVPSGLQYNTYAVKYSPEGFYQWVKFVEDVTCSTPRIVAHSENEVYYSSYLYGDFMFDDFQAEGQGQTGTNFFLAKLNNEGQYQWVREVPSGGGVGLGRSNFLNLDGNGNIYISGSADGAIDWGNGVQTPGGPRKSLLLKYNPEGTVVSAITAGGGYGRADGVALNADGDAFIAGIASGDTTFGSIEYDGGDEYYPYLTKIVMPPLGVKEQKAATVTLYPNPASDYIYISGVEEVKGSIINILGQKVMDFEANPSKPVNVAGFPQGTYLVKMEGFSTKKFIKE